MSETLPWLLLNSVTGQAEVRRPVKMGFWLDWASTIEIIYGLSFTVSVAYTGLLCTKLRWHSHSSHCLVCVDALWQSSYLLVRELGVSNGALQGLHLSLCHTHSLLGLNHLGLQFSKGLQKSGVQPLVSVLHRGQTTHLSQLLICHFPTRPRP